MNENTSDRNLLENKFLRYILMVLSIIGLTVVLFVFSSVDTKALSLKCNISTVGPMTGNLNVTDFPTGTSSFYSNQTAYFNIAGDTDVSITKLSLTLYKNGSYYDTTNVTNFSNFIRYAACTYNDLPAGSYYYKWDFTANGGSSSSGNIYFTVSDPTYIVSSPSNTTVKSGNTAYFSASASGGKSSLSYQWYYSSYSSGSGTLISGATSSSYSVTASSSNSGRYYYCRVTDGERGAITSRARLTTSYTISYNGNGGSETPSSQTKIHDSAITLSSTRPTRIGYSFLGWSTSSSATSVSYSPGDNFTTNANTTLYAVWRSAYELYENSINQVSIKKDNPVLYYAFTPSISGKYVIYSSVTEDTKVTLYNSNYTPLSTDDDSGDNKNFRLEYYLTAGQKYIFGLQYYNTDTEGTLKFIFGKVYTISYSANGGSGAPASQSKDYEKTLTLSSSKPTRSGYNFLGWSDSNSAKSPSFFAGGNYSYNANKTLYAVWGDNTNPTCSITSTNNSSTSQTVTLNFSDNIGISGYYWGKNSDYTNNTFYSTTSTSVIVSVNSEGTYYLRVKDSSGNISSVKTITFVKVFLNGNGAIIPQSYIVVKSNASVTPSYPSNNGFAFVGWSTTKSSTSGNKSITPTANTTYYAIWKDIAKPSCTTKSTNYTSTSQTVTLYFSDNVRVAGYYWGKSAYYSDNIFYSKSYSDTRTVTQEGTYYIVVKDSSGNLSNTYTIEFEKISLDAQGGNVSPNYIITSDRSAISLPTPIRSGYTFVDWSLVDNNSYKAKWDKNPSPTPPKPTSKKSQTITAKSYTKVYGSKAFNLGAKAKTKLSYKSSDKKVVTVSANGKITIKGVGKATITITASSNSSYKSATRKITIIVNPKSVSRITYKVLKSHTVQLNWSKVSGINEYEVNFSYNKNFPGSGTIKKSEKSNTRKYKGFNKNVYIRIRTVKKYKGANYYGVWKTVYVKFKK